MHSLDSLDIQIPVVLQRFVPLFLELEDCVVSEFFIIEFASSFCPGKFSGVVLGPEVAMAFGPAEPKIFAIVSDKHDSMAWVDWP